MRKFLLLIFLANALILNTAFGMQTEEIQRIVGNNSPDDFANFVNSAPNPNYSGDATYSITLANVQAGGGLDFPLTLTYNSNAVRENVNSGYVGFGWDLNIGEVVRAVNYLPDEQNTANFGPNEDFNFGGNTNSSLLFSEWDGIIYNGDMISDLTYPSATGPVPLGPSKPDNWDNYNLSTPYGSANLVTVIPTNGVTPFYFMETPYQSWQIDYQRSAAFNDYFSEFSLLDDMGRSFSFDYAHFVRLDYNGDGVKTNAENGNNYYRYPINWKLTKIESPNSDHYVDIIYDDYAHAGESMTSGVNQPYKVVGGKNSLLFAGKRAPEDIFGVITYDESVVDYIETLSHKIEFEYQVDSTQIDVNDVARKLLKKIKVFSKKDLSQPIKEVSLFYETKVQHQGSISYTLVNLLDRVTFHNPKDYGLNPHNTNSFDLDYYPNLTSVYADKFGYLKTNNLLKSIQLPTGGSIEYEYEDRRYSFYYDFDQTDDYLDQVYDSINTSDEYLSGTRVSKITLDGITSDSPTIVKEFSYGEGVRVDNNWESIISNYGSTKGYSNRILGHVGHRWVEEKDSEGGFSKTFYTSGISHPDLHSHRCYVDPVDLPDHCPSFVNEEEAMSVFFENNPESSFSGVTYYTNFNESYGKPYKSEVGYYSGSNRIVKQTSNSKWIKVESDQLHPQQNTNFNSDVTDVSRTFFTYKLYDKVTTDGKEVSTYYVGHTFNDDISGGNSRPRFHEYYAIKTPPQFVITVDEYDETTFVKEYSYLGGWGWAHNKSVNMINIKTADFTLKEINADYGGLYRTVICDMGITHPVSCPSVATPLPDYPGLNAAFYSNTIVFNGGTMTYWDNTDGEYRPRKTYTFTDTNLSRYIDPCTHPYCSTPLNADSSGSNSSFNLPYTNNGRLLISFDEYDSIGNLIEASDAFGISTSLDLTSDGKVTGVFKNAIIENVFAHSFAYEGLSNLATPVEEANGVTTSWSISNGKLKMQHPGNSNPNYAVDYLKMGLDSEYTGRTVIELDVTAGEDNLDRTLAIGVGGSSYSGGNGGTENLVWTMFSYGDWSYFDGAWKVIESGFEEGLVYNLKIVVDPSTDKVDYYVNGELILENVNGRENLSGVQTIGIANYGRATTAAEWFIDNVRIYPEDAQATSQELDWYSQKPLAIKAVDGSTERYSYDDFGRLDNFENKNGKVISEFRYLYGSKLTTLMSQYTGYDEEIPNEISTITYANGINANSIFDTWAFDGYIDSKKGLVGIANETLDFEEGRFGLAAKFGGGSNNDHIELGDIEFMDNASEFSVSLWFNREVDASSSTAHSVNNILIAQSSSATNDNLEIGTDGVNVEVYLDTGSGSQDAMRSYNAGIVNNQWYHLGLTYNAALDQTILYINGDKVKTWTDWKVSLENSVSSPLSIGLARPDDGNTGPFTGLIDEFKLFTKTLTSEEIKSLYTANTVINYSDGLGRSIQSQIRSGNTSIISGRVYDGRSLEVASSKSIGVIGTFGYNDDLFNGTGTFTPSQSLVSNSDLQDYWDLDFSTNDANFAYSYSEYENSKTNRAISSTIPGYEHRYGSGAELTSSYGLNASSISTANKTWTANSLFKTVSVDAINNQGISYTDFLGRTVASGVNWNTDNELDDSSDLITYFEYDYNSNISLVEDPKGNETTYSYNAVGQLLEKELADQDHNNKYCYDRKGRLRFHADPNDFDDPYNYNGTNHYGYTYTKYDDFDRPVEVGIQDASYVSQNSEASYNIICSNSTLLNDQNEPNANTTPQIYYSYDGVNKATSAQNYEGRLTRVQYKDLNTGQWGYTWYSYNNLGLVEFIIQRHPGQSNYYDRTISYEYDELGRTTKVSYDEGYSTTNNHYFWYYYDEFGRLEKVTSYGVDTESSSRTEAEYIYYTDGQIKQLILGNGAQTLDYDYTIQGWLEDINDGAGGNMFSMTLDYELNGNISEQIWYQEQKYTSGLYPRYEYNYDNANRLTSACFGGLCNGGQYDVTYQYDKSGNITQIRRDDDNGSTSNSNGQLDMTYQSGNNRIDILYQNGDDWEPGYDANGNINFYESQNITSANYDWRNLPSQIITSTGLLKFAYDGEGNRITKSINGGATTYYVRDASGQTLAVYEDGTLLYLNILAGGQIIGQIIKN